LNLEFSKLKIAWRMKKMKKSKEKIFNDLDKDNTGYLEPLDILNGLKNYLYVYLSRDETNKLVCDLDEDHSGDIDFGEFDEKINTENLGERT
jgi:Ca2+-binding EF-hand superfamily protein